MKRALKIGGVLLAVVVVLVLGLFVFLQVRVSGFDEQITFAEEPAPAVTASTDPVVIARGRALVYGPAHCSQCHGTYAREKPQDNVDGVPLTGNFEFAMGPIGTTWSANLTPTGIGALTDAQVARAITAGVTHDGTLSVFMRYSASNLSAEDVTAIVSYLRTLPAAGGPVRKGELSWMGKAMFSFLTIAPDRAPLPTHVPESDQASVERGAYLAEHASLCIGCHTTYDPMTFAPVGPKGGGGTPEPSHGPDSDKEYAPPNLTSSPVGMTGRLSEDEFVARIRHGRAFPTSVMPWENFQRMTDADVRSVYRYLRALPPVAVDSGPSYRDVGWKPPT